MLFRYYITSTDEGCIFGTNNEQTARQYALSEDYFVVDAHTGEWIQADLGRRLVEEKV